jgi:hypothetical protein
MPSMTRTVLEMEIPIQVANLRRVLSEPKLANGAEEHLTAIAAVSAAFDRDLDACLDNVLLSPQGKADGAEKLAREANAKLDAFESSRIGALDRQIASVVASLNAVTAKPLDGNDRVIAEIRAESIRSQFRGLDVLEVVALYVGADDDARLALESAPMVVRRVRPGGMSTLEPLVPVEHVTRAQIARAEAKSPEQAATLRDCEKLVSVYRGAVETARRAIAEVVPTSHQAPVLMS